MKFALIDNIKTESTKGAVGTCPGCGATVVAKCGDVKVHHWAHKGIRNCDPWWENETAWHRTWKNNFPSEWQESIATDKFTGEKHIADVRTTHGLVIEFQHSFIDQRERKKRESFYKHMVWVVDGTRLERDYTRFLEGAKDLRPAQKQGHYLVNFPDECFPSNWLGSSMPVIFDFSGHETINDPKDTRSALYYLYPKKEGTKSLLARISRQSLINDIIVGEFLQQQPAPQQEPPKPLARNGPGIIQRPSQYVYDRGRFVRKQRF